MGTKAARNSGINDFVGDLLAKEGMNLFEKWFAHLQQLSPAQKISDFDVRDKMLEEIVALVSEGNSLILSKKDISMVEEMLNKFLQQNHLLK